MSREGESVPLGQRQCLHTFLVVTGICLWGRGFYGHLIGTDQGRSVSYSAENSAP